MSQRAAAIIYRWRLPLSAVILLGALVLSPRADITRIDNDITAWFSKEDPVYRDYERFREEFGGTRSLIVALEAGSPERLFARDTLKAIERISGDIERIDTVHRVWSLSTATVVEATADGLDVRPLLENADTQPPEDVKRRALRDDLLRGDLVSEDATVTAIVVSFDEDRIDDVRAGVIQRIHDVVDPQLPPGVRAHYNGSLEISETYNRVTLDNQRTFMPPIFVLTVLAIYLTFRSVRRTFLACIAVASSVLWTLGLYTLMGFSYNVLSSMLAPLIVVLAIADDVHIMQHWEEERRLGDNEFAFKRTVAHLMKPLFGASVTTALGMLSLATSDVVAVRAFGIGSAVGIMIDFAFSVVLMPTLLTFVKPEARQSPHERYLVPPMLKIARISSAHPGRVLAIAFVIAAAAIAGMVRLRVDTNHIHFFSGGHPLGESARVIDSKLAGVYSFQIMLEGEPESLRTPEALRRIDRLEGELRKFPEVRKVTSVADYVRRINKELNDGKPEADVVPDDAETIAQELFVFALGGEGRHELERVVASDFSRAQINIKLRSMSSDVVLEIVERTERMAADAFAGTGIRTMATGSGKLFSILDHYLVVSQLSSFGMAFVTVFGVIFIVFRSFRFGLLTIAPNLLPVLAVLGLMGHLDISLNVATVMVASIALGVVDDDTIHFINRYRREVGAGATTDEAILTATSHEGRASLTTAMINTAGYGVLLTSEYRPTAWFGGLLALTMSVAFLAEVFLLPAIIKKLPRFYGHEALRAAARKGPPYVAILLVLAFASSAAAQTRPTGYISAFADFFPNRNDTTEIRLRAFAEQKLAPSDDVRVTLSGFVEGLARSGGARDAIASVHDASVEAALGRVDLLAGFTRVAWGRLDELQPTDVINPLDVSRFFFEGRSEARLPVALVRARLFFTDDAVLEGVYVPAFRRGRFDRLDEPTSPFNLAAEVEGLPLEDREPAIAFRNSQGGARFSATTGRVDWSVSAYRGIESFGLYSAAPRGLVREYPRFTMVGADFETVRGEWGLRGEVAAFVRDSFQEQAAFTRGRSFDAGVGLDRKAGDYRISGTALVHREPSRTDLSLIVATDRAFAREKYSLRLFGVYGATEGSGFVRGILTGKLRDDVALEGSAGWFAGGGRDLAGRFADSDFAYARLKVYF